MTPLLTVIIPVYNEARTIDELLDRVFASSLAKEIVVVDDGSTDSTATKLAARLPTVIIHPGNRGKGASIRTGLKHAEGTYTIIQDADLEYDPQDYERLLAPLLAGQADAVYGSRYFGESQVPSPRSQVAESGAGSGDLRATALSGEQRAAANSEIQSGGKPPHSKMWSMCRLGVALLNRLVKWYYGVQITDEATCYKVFRTADLRAMDLQCERFEFCPEVTAKACRMGLRIVEVPISYAPRSVAQGKKVRWRDGWTAIRTLWRYRRWRQDASSRPFNNRTPTFQAADLKLVRRPAAQTG